MADSQETRVDAFVETELDRRAAAIEQKLDADVMAIVGPIYSGVDHQVRQAIEARRQTPSPRTRIAIVLETYGGVIEVVERMVITIRHNYQDVRMIIPNCAMSAGAVFAMSGDAIMMDYFSCLGPIDPQIMRKGELVPALSYLAQFRRLKKRSRDGKITSAELAMLVEQLDLGELHTFEQARDLSIALLKQWLAKYKFKDWSVTETRREKVTDAMREKRAEDIALQLMDQDRWHSHGRPISMEVLKKDINLKIDDFGGDPELSQRIKDYYHFLADYMGKIGVFGIVHVSGTCLKWS